MFYSVDLLERVCVCVREDLVGQGETFINLFIFLSFSS